MSDTPQVLAWPVRVENSSYATVDQGSLAAVQQSVGRIGTVEQGEMQAVAPWMGLPSLEGLSTAPDPDLIADAITGQEPDALVSVLRVPDPSRSEGWDVLRVEVDVA